MTCGVYMLTNKKNGKKYVGQSATVEKRINDHLTGRPGCPVMQNAVKRYGPDGFTVEILAECAPDALDALEMFYISVHGSFGPRGYNLTEGGGGIRGIVRSDEVRKKISDAHKVSERAKKHLADIHNSPGHNDHLRALSRSEASRERSSKRMKEYVKTDEHIAHLRAISATPEASERGKAAMAKNRLDPIWVAKQKAGASRGALRRRTFRRLAKAFGFVGEAILLEWECATVREDIKARRAA